jgi:outer membrane lipoprotein-sorting protein
VRWTTARFAALAAAGLGVAAAAVAQPDGTPATLESIERCVADNAPARTMRQRIELRTEDRMGDGRRYDVKGEWKKGDDGLSKLLMRVSAPADLRGSAFLMIEREGREPDLFSYLPELEKVRRITMRSAAGSLFGSDFSYEDMQRLHDVVDTSSSVLLGEDEQEGRPSWQVETRPAAETGSAYSRIVAWVDRERCVPLRMEFYERDDAPAKVLTAPPAEVVQEGAGWVPTELRLENVGQGTRTLLSVKDVELDVELPDKDFSQGALRRRR